MNEKDPRDGFRNPGFFATNGDNNRFSQGSRYNDHFPRNKMATYANRNARDERRDDGPKHIIEKNIYNENTIVKNLSPTDIHNIRKKHEITTIGDNVVPNPIDSFDQIEFPRELHDKLLKSGFTAPTAVQAQGWPIALSGNDLIAIAETGSGKTLGYLFPAFMHIRAQKAVFMKRHNARPIVLVMAPTRELTEQIKVEAERFGSVLGINTAAAYGGAPRGPQAYELRKNIHILIACPGRLIDFIESKTLSLDFVSFLVLDEADRMLDMGFKPQIENIVPYIRQDRQTCLFSATWPKELKSLCKNLLANEVVHFYIGNTGLNSCKNIVQHIIFTDTNDDKYKELSALLCSDKTGRKVLIFANTKADADSITRQLRNFSVYALSIHGDKSQAHRNRVLDQFKSGTNIILVATDVAARGLDVKDISCVINFDMAGDIESYIHRIGRTGRAGAVGTSYTFFSKKDTRLASELSEVLRSAEQNIPDELGRIAANNRGGHGDKMNRYSRRPGPYRNQGYNNFYGQGFSNGHKYTNGNKNPNSEYGRNNGNGYKPMQTQENGNYGSANGYQQPPRRFHAPSRP